jgi:hypothetical protein
MNARYIPSGYSLYARDERFCFEVYAKTDDRIYAICYGGKRNKPDWHYRFNDLQRLNDKIAESLSGLMAWEEAKQKRKAQRSAPHDVKVGDVFRCSWGYDQTNIDYYEVTAVRGQMVEVCGISQEREETLSMQGYCVPSPGSFIGKPMTKKVNMGGGEPSIRIYSFASAYRMKPAALIGNKPVYESSHWTAYA